MFVAPFSVFFKCFHFIFEILKTGNEQVNSDLESKRCSTKIFYNLDGVSSVYFILVASFRVDPYIPGATA